MPLSAAVRDFLLQFKQAVTQGSGVDIVPRQDTLRTMSQLGLTKSNLEELLLSLSVADYCKGPEDDRDRSGHIWVFGKQVAQQDVYIKLKVFDVKGVSMAKCISFHIAEFEMKYPYRQD